MGVRRTCFGDLCLAKADPEMVLGDVTAVLMAKRPEPGAVKTRLVGPGGFEPEAAAQLSWAMLRCTAHRLRFASPRVILAVSPDGCGRELAKALGVEFAQIVDQGAGDLGRRLERVWKIAGGEGRIAFFGVDAPDVPVTALREIPHALANHDLAVGPTKDGGYWTLAAGAFHPEVIRGIDWGSDRVYDQTRQRAAEAGLEVYALTRWYDVDQPSDVEALSRRLEERLGSSPTGSVDERALRRLAEQIRILTKSSASPESSP